MTTKKYYEAPAIEVVELKLQGSLLAGSGDEEYESDLEGGNGYGSVFD